jgi:hypothetical protein
MVAAKNQQRETTALYRGRNLIVRIGPYSVEIRRKGQRWSSAYTIPWRAVYELGGRLRARENLKKKGRRRKSVMLK